MAFCGHCSPLTCRYLYCSFAPAWLALLTVPPTPILTALHPVDIALAHVPEPLCCHPPIAKDTPGVSTGSLPPVAAWLRHSTPSIISTAASIKPSSRTQWCVYYLTCCSTLDLAGVLHAIVVPPVACSSSESGWSLCMRVEISGLSSYLLDTT